MALLMTAPEAAERLGLKVWQVRKAVADGSLKSGLRRGTTKPHYFTEEDLRDYVQNGMERANG